METVKTAVAELNDRQILVILFEDGTLHIAERNNSWDTWGRPVYTQFETVEEGGSIELA
jgi:hypothetical protein